MAAGAERTTETLAAALEREHREIDAGIGEFLAARQQGEGKTEPLRRAIDALRRHIFLEEAFLFPPLREAGLVAPIFVMQREHGELWDTMDAIDGQLRDGAAGGLADAACEELVAALERHNSKEEAIVYPQADDVLSATANASLHAFLAAGAMPEGWACAQAGA